MDTPSSVGRVQGDARDYRPCWGSRVCSCCVFYDWKCRMQSEEACCCLSFSVSEEQNPIWCVLFDVRLCFSLDSYRIPGSRVYSPCVEDLSIWYDLNCAVLFFFNQNLYSCLFPLYSKIIERCFEVCDTWSTTLLSGGHRFFLELCPRMSSKSWRRRSRPKLIMETGLFI